jgi:hypothetical protein
MSAKGKPTLSCCTEMADRAILLPETCRQAVDLENVGREIFLVFGHTAGPAVCYGENEARDICPVQSARPVAVH